MWAAATGKARLPTVASLTGGTTRRLVPAERRALRPGTSTVEVRLVPEVRLEQLVERMRRRQLAHHGNDERLDDQVSLEQVRDAERQVKVGTAHPQLGGDPVLRLVTWCPHLPPAARPSNHYHYVVSTRVVRGLG